MISQDTADKIAAYAAEKQNELHGRFAEKSGMTTQERRTFYEGFSSDGAEGDSVEELLDAGIITQEQADAIMEWIAE